MKVHQGGEGGAIFPYDNLRDIFLNRAIFLFRVPHPNFYPSIISCRIVKFFENTPPPYIDKGKMVVYDFNILLPGGLMKHA